MTAQHGKHFGNLLIISLFISAVSFGQQKKDSLPPKQDTAIVVMNEFLTFLQDKLTVKEYVPIQQMVGAFLKSKEYLKPNKK